MRWKEHASDALVVLLPWGVVNYPLSTSAPATVGWGGVRVGDDEVERGPLHLVAGLEGEQRWFGVVRQRDGDRDRNDHERRALEPPAEEAGLVHGSRDEPKESDGHDGPNHEQQTRSHDKEHLRKIHVHH